MTFHIGEYVWVEGRLQAQVVMVNHEKFRALVAIRGKGWHEHVILPFCFLHREPVVETKTR